MKINLSNFPLYLYSNSPGAHCISIAEVLLQSYLYNTMLSIYSRHLESYYIDTVESYSG